jgi:hypothetical protein
MRALITYEALICVNSLWPSAPQLAPVQQTSPGLLGAFTDAVDTAHDAHVTGRHLVWLVDRAEDAGRSQQQFAALPAQLLPAT